MSQQATQKKSRIEPWQQLQGEFPKPYNACVQILENRVSIYFVLPINLAYGIPADVLAALQATRSTAYPKAVASAKAWTNELTRAMQASIRESAQLSDPTQVTDAFIDRLHVLEFKFINCSKRAIGDYTWCVEIQSDGFTVGSDTPPVTITDWDFLVAWLKHGPHPCDEEVLLLRDGCPDMDRFGEFEIEFDTDKAYHRNARVFHMRVPDHPACKETAHAWFYMTHHMTVNSVQIIHLVVESLVRIDAYDRCVSLHSLDWMCDAIQHCKQQHRMSRADTDHLALAEEVIRSVIAHSDARFERATRKLIVEVDKNLGVMPDILDAAFVEIATALTFAINDRKLAGGTRVDIIARSRDILSGLMRKEKVGAVTATCAAFLRDRFTRERDRDIHNRDKHRAAGTDDEESSDSDSDSDSDRDSDSGSGSDSGSSSGSGSSSSGSGSGSSSSSGSGSGSSSGVDEDEDASGSECEMDSDDESEAQSTEEGDEEEAPGEEAPVDEAPAEEAGPSRKRVCRRSDAAGQSDAPAAALHLLDWIDVLLRGVRDDQVDGSESDDDDPDANVDDPDEDDPATEPGSD